MHIGAIGHHSQSGHLRAALNVGTPQIGLREPPGRPMRIENLISSQDGEVARVSATVLWEDCERPPFELIFETEGVASGDLESNPHAFLTACFVPALDFGERRILIAEEICPELLHGLETNARWLVHWSGGQLRPLRIECVHARTEVPTRSEKRVGSFLSGGVDSLATLRTNRLDFPLGHSASIRDCVMVRGFDIGGTTRAGTEEAFFARSIAPLRDIALDARVNLILITTNVRLLHDDVRFWIHRFHGAALASVAHSLSTRLARMYIGSSDNIPVPDDQGSHPLLDANYGSHELQIWHDGLYLSRLEKVKRVAEWPVALRNLRVCTMNPDTGLNCGRCEKCLRTMLELLAVGKLEDAESFPVQHIDMDTLDTLSICDDYQLTLYQELPGAPGRVGARSVSQSASRRS